MRPPLVAALTLSLLSLAGPSLRAQAIVAATSGIPNPGAVIDFGANLFPNFTAVSNQFPGITIYHASYFTTGTSNNLVGGFLTNDFSGPPDTLRIVFAQPITDLSFVYHQIGTSRPTNFRAMFGTTIVDSFSNSSNQSQPNNWFGFTNIVFDELQLDFVGDFNVDMLEFNVAGGARCQVRNGSNLNPLAYSCTTRPVMGTTWQAAIATTPNTIASFIAFAPGGPHPGFPLLNGEVLVQPVPDPIFLSGLNTFSLAIPNGPIWQGFQVTTQGLRLDTVGPTVTYVLLNAIDLVLGQ